MERVEMVERIIDSGPSMRGFFIPYSEFRTGQDLDGTAARKFLESKGFKVILNYDCGNNGWAITEDGYRLSTNGWFCHSPIKEGEGKQ